MAFTAVGTLIEGAADFATVAAAVGEVGTAISVVGAVTGNPTLTKVGGVMGLAGGIGSLASGGFSGAAGSAADEFGNVATDASGNALSSAATSPDFNDATNTLTDPTTGAQTFGGDTANNLGATDNGFGAQTFSVPGAGTNSNLPSLNTDDASSGIINGAMNNPTTAADGTAATAATAPTAPTATGGATDSTYNNIANSTGGTGATPASATSTTAPATASPAVGGNLSSPTSSTASAAANPNLNITTAQSAGSSANLPTQAGMPAVKPAAGLDYNAAQDSQAYNSASGVGPSSSGSGGYFSGLTNWINQNPKSAQVYGQLLGGALGGVGQAYQANLQNNIAKGNLNLANQRQNNANAQVASAGIINSARKKPTTGS